MAVIIKALLRLINPELKWLCFRSFPTFQCSHVHYVNDKIQHEKPGFPQKKISEISLFLSWWQNVDVLKFQSVVSDKCN